MITSAGVVLAATFTVLGVLPPVFLADLGFAVVCGVPLGTFIVRGRAGPSLGLRHRPDHLVAVQAGHNRPAAPEDRAVTAHPTSSRRHDRDNTMHRTLSARQRPTHANLTRRVPRPAAPDIGRHQRAPIARPIQDAARW